ncbi:MAG: glycosyltransferase family 39 protein [Gemmataceae bacterium]|nr:glycosyltransferase family 39 protein [Gemmata sp.]MDW8198864.1 glycosyltransferase family 39 protein [Gemmataceae bacterium]
MLLLFFYQLGQRDLVSSHEARAAQHAQRMLDTGDWGLPTLFDGQTDFQKPPGYYWMVALVGRLNGGHVSPWVARCPAAASAAVTVWLVYVFLRREGYRCGAFWAAMALATANHFVAIGRTARIDVPLTAAITIALVTFFTTERHFATKSRWSAMKRIIGWVVAALAGGWAVLLKGPVALALLGAVAAMYYLLERRWPPIGLLLVSGAVVSLVALPWFIWANQVTEGEWVRVFVWYHNVARFTGESEALASHPWWYYGPRLTLALLPWSVPLVPLLVWAVRSGVGWHDHVVRFGLIWLVAMVAMLSAAQFKRADYLLPAFPGAAIVLGCTAERWLYTHPSRRAAQWLPVAAVVLVAAGWAIGPILWWVVEPQQAARHAKKPFAAAIRAHAPQPQPILLFRTESHLLTFHLGMPVHTLVEWGALKEWFSAPGEHTVVMPPEYAAAAEQITGRKLVPVVSLAECLAVPPSRPLVCWRTAPTCP